METSASTKLLVCITVKDVKELTGVFGNPEEYNMKDWYFILMEMCFINR